jgi:pSer/pThr/pTyr-binding forkhead associated (FHA) protein
MIEGTANWLVTASEPRRAVVRRVLQVAADLDPTGKAPEPQARLLVVEGPAGSVAMRARSRLLLGRSTACDLVVSGPGVSRVHAAVVRRGGEYWLEDLESANGTWCGAERVQRRRIAGGEEIRLCGTPVRFYLW